MVKFSCFQAQSPSQKHKKTVRQSSKTMEKTLEDPSHNEALRSPSYLTKENNPCLKEEGGQNYVSGHVTDFSPTASTKENNPCLKGEGEQNYVSGHVADFSPTASEEIEVKYITDDDNVVHKDGQFKKCQSLGSVLNWEQRISGDDGSQDETEQRFSYDGNKHGLSQTGKFPDPVPSDSVQVGSDFAKNISMFSIGDPQPSEKEDADNDFYLPEDLTPRILPGIVISTSLPDLASPYRCSTSFLARSRSADDLKTLDSTKQGMNAHETGRQGQYQERDSNSVFNNDKNVENHGDGTDYTYNYVGSAKDWIVPASYGENRGKSIVSETSSKNWDEVPAKDFRLKRIEEWVINLQNSGPMEESNESDNPRNGEQLSEGNAILEEPTTVKAEVKVNPGMEAAKRYISSLNALATAAQLTNLGLVVIPFLSAFASLKALNLSGNAIGSVAAGALPRGLHVLNLSKNNISTIEGLRDLTRLRVLDLSYNRILRIGHGLAACPSLKELYLAGNKISEVEGLHRLLKLNVLDLRFNKISTTKCLGQLTANYNSLQALSLEGNPLQKNIKDEQLKKHLQSLLPHLTYYNRQSIKFGTVKDSAERTPRMGIGSHQVDRGFRLEVNVRKGAHGIVAQKVPSSHGRKSQGVRKVRLPPSGVKMSAVHGEITEVGGKVLSSRGDFSFPRSRSEGNLGAL